MIVKKKYWERPIQLVCLFEIKSTMSAEELNKRLRIANIEDQNEVIVERLSRIAKEKG